MPLVDANIVLRYLLDDHPELSRQAADILEHHDVVVPVEVLCEVVYVLQKVYHISREQIRQKLTALIDEQLIAVERVEVFHHALRGYSVNSLDLVDAYLWAYNTVEQQQVFTFDEKLQKYLRTPLSSIDEGGKQPLDV